MYVRVSMRGFGDAKGSRAGSACSLVWRRSHQCVFPSVFRLQPLLWLFWACLNACLSVLGRLSGQMHLEPSPVSHQSRMRPPNCLVLDEHRGPRYSNPAHSSEAFTRPAALVVHRRGGPAHQYTEAVDPPHRPVVLLDPGSRPHRCAS